MQDSSGRRHREPGHHHQQKAPVTPRAHLDAFLPTAPRKLPHSRCKDKDAAWKEHTDPHCNSQDKITSSRNKRLMFLLNPEAMHVLFPLLEPPSDPSSLLYRLLLSGSLPWFTYLWARSLSCRNTWWRTSLGQRLLPCCNHILTCPSQLNSEGTAEPSHSPALQHLEQGSCLVNTC